METKLLIIIGMHRSGTSLITQWLKKCGLNVGNNLMIPNKSNEQGYFEDMDFVQLHENILKQHKLPDTGIVNASLEQLSFEEKKEITELLECKGNNQAQWGWKDPRTCLFLESYRELVPQAKYLVIYRGCDFCVYSLVNRMLRDKQERYFESDRKNSTFWWRLYKRGKSLKDFLKNHAEELVQVWIHYNKELLCHIELLGREQCVVVDYHFLLKNDNRLLRFLTDIWSFDLNSVRFHQVYNKKLMSTKAVINPYIKNKCLLSMVSELESKLKSYSLT